MGDPHFHLRRNRNREDLPQFESRYCFSSFTLSQVRLVSVVVDEIIGNEEPVGVISVFQVEEIIIVIAHYLNFVTKYPRRIRLLGKPFDPKAQNQK